MHPWAALTHDEVRDASGSGWVAPSVWCGSGLAVLSATAFAWSGPLGPRAHGRRLVGGRRPSRPGSCSPGLVLTPLGDRAAARPLVAGAPQHLWLITALRPRRPSRGAQLAFFNAVAAHAGRGRAADRVHLAGRGRLLAMAAPRPASRPAHGGRRGGVRGRAGARARPAVRCAVPSPGRHRGGRSSRCWGVACYFVLSSHDDNGLPGTVLATGGLLARLASGRRWGSAVGHRPAHRVRRPRLLPRRRGAVVAAGGSGWASSRQRSPMSAGIVGLPQCSAPGSRPSWRCSRC